VILAAAVVAANTAKGQAEDKDKLPEGKGKDYVASVCTQCHGLEATTGSRRTLEEWRIVVNDMVSNGAALDEDEVEIVSQYLAKNFGPEKSEKESGAEKKSGEKESEKKSGEKKEKEEPSQ